VVAESAIIATQAPEGKVLVPDALPHGAGPMVATLGSTDSTNMRLSSVAAAPAGAVDTDAGSPSATFTPASPRAVLEQQSMQLPRPALSPSSDTSASGHSHVTAVRPEENLYGIRRPVSPVSSPQAVAPVVAGGTPAALEDNTQTSPHRHKK